MRLQFEPAASLDSRLEMARQNFGHYLRDFSRRLFRHQRLPKTAATALRPPGHSTRSYSLDKEVNQLKKRVKELENAIKKHRKQTGHNMCWENDEELWSVLKDGKKFNHKPPPWDEFITRCAAYRKSREP